MKSFPSSSSSSSSSYSLSSTSLTNRLETIFKKAWELSILCGIEICVIYYGPEGELKTWPEEREKVKDMAFRYSQAERRKKRVDLYGFLNKKQNKEGKHLNKKKKTMSSEKTIQREMSTHHCSMYIDDTQASSSLFCTTISLSERYVFFFLFFWPT